MSIVIGRPIEEVFAVLADLENDVKWRCAWVEARNTSDGSFGVGTTTHLVGEGLGRRTEAEYEITDHEPDRLVAWKTLSGPLPLTFRIQIPTNSLYLVAELFGLILVLAGSFASVVMAIAWKQFGARSDAPVRRIGDWSEAGHS